MGVLRHRRRHHHINLYSTLTALAFLLLISAAAIRTTPNQAGGQQQQQQTEIVSGPSGDDQLERITAQTRLSGPGSSPPRCRSKCGRCSPCKAVHVPIQPGLSTPLEYYPEAWRCKCGNKLFMP
ncbi:hypothetical protein M0R45_018218 [Rubus argutus]|uniref:Epidermal patterning factor-like protein n=1 Tax=Rubus argutus TaxID=59490 RepID=A0AAW1X5M1_RUBAR